MSCEQFERWLRRKLQELNTDHDTFGSYITSIVEGDDSRDDKLDALQGILSEITCSDALLLSNEILNEWAALAPRKPNGSECVSDVGSKLASIMEKQSQAYGQEKKVSDEKRRLRESILAQYSQVSDSDDEEPKAKEGAACPTVEPSVPKNTNAEDVMRAERDKKEKSRAESEKKKALDKANKEKQKRQNEERKEKEKKRTQKGERKR